MTAADPSPAALQQTLVLLKPDTLQRRLVGRILARFEDKGLTLAGMRMLRVCDDLARKLYKVHEGKDFYEPLVEFITSGPVVACVFRGQTAIDVVRAMMGPTFGPEAPAGTIRGDYGMSRRLNLVHGSDSPDAAKWEISLFFGAADLVEYEDAARPWIYGSGQ